MKNTEEIVSGGPGEPLEDFKNWLYNAFPGNHLEVQLTEPEQEPETEPKTDSETDPEAIAIKQNRKDVSDFTGIPENLFTADTVEGCIEQAKAMIDFFETNKIYYPVVHDCGNAEEVLARSKYKKDDPAEEFLDWLCEVMPANVFGY